MLLQQHPPAFPVSSAQAQAEPRPELLWEEQTSWLPGPGLPQAPLLLGHLGCSSQSRAECLAPPTTPSPATLHQASMAVSGFAFQPCPLLPHTSDTHCPARFLV